MLACLWDVVGLLDVIVSAITLKMLAPEKEPDSKSALQLYRR